MAGDTMADFDWQFIAAIFGSGTASSLLTLWFGRKKSSAEAVKIEADANRTDVETSATANKLLLETIAQLQKQLTDQLGRIDQMDQEIVKLRTIHAEQITEIANLRLEVARLRTSLPFPDPRVPIGARAADPLEDQDQTPLPFPLSGA